MSLPNQRDHATLRRLWAEVEKYSGFYASGDITEVEMCRCVAKTATRLQVEAENRRREHDEDWKILDGQAGDLL